jgi:hypothetical protein
MSTASITVAGFLPSRAGLHFVNAFPAEPAVRLDLGPVGSIALGDASKGLCGGMVFTVLDLVEAGLPAPDLDTPPAEGSPLFRYLVSRLVDSWNAPAGVLTYLRWMGTPDHDLGFEPFVLHGLGWMTVRQQWPRIKASIDAGHPCPLGLVTAHSMSLGDLGENHQVLAYGYDVDGSDLRVRVYDPNTGREGADDAHLALSTASPQHTTPIEHNLAIDHPVRGFFATPYTPRDPRPALA